MRKKTLSLLLLLLFLTTFLAGCGTSEGDKFLGRWVGNVPGLKNEKRYLDISTKDNKTFAVNFVSPDGTIEMKNTAILKDNYLELAFSERIVLAPDNTITFRNGDFSKPK